jgi:DNA-directed RNA polymerase subunit H (RpoH/RPB5)
MNTIWNKDGIYFTINNLNNYLFNILKHDMVPNHTVLSDEETEKLKKQYNILYDNQLPEISRYDPVAEAIGLRPDQVCKILRKSKTAITAPYYRLCC